MSLYQCQGHLKHEIRHEFIIARMAKVIVTRKAREH